MRTNITDGVAVLEIDTPQTNVINPAFISELNQHLDEVETNDRARSLLLTARHEKVFSPGLDVVTLYNFSYGDTRTFVIDFCKLYLRLFSFPRPVVVALNGHAIAGGFILAMTGDVKLIKGGDTKIGLTEIDIGMPLPAGCVEMLRYGLAAGPLQQMLYSGRLIGPEEALGVRAVDGAVDGERLPRVAFEQALALAKKPLRAFRKMKECLRGDYVDLIEEKDEKHLDELLDQWTSEETRCRIGMLVQKLKSRQS